MNSQIERTLGHQHHTTAYDRKCARGGGGGLVGPVEITGCRDGARGMGILSMCFHGRVPALLGFLAR